MSKPVENRDRRRLRLLAMRSASWSVPTPVGTTTITAFICCDLTADSVRVVPAADSRRGFPLLTFVFGIGVVMIRFCGARRAQRLTRQVETRRCTTGSGTEPAIANPTSGELAAAVKDSTAASFESSSAVRTRPGPQNQPPPEPSLETSPQS